MDDSFANVSLKYFFIRLFHPAQIAAKTVFIKLLAGFEIPQAASVGRDLVRQARFYLPAVTDRIPV